MVCIRDSRIAPAVAPALPRSFGATEEVSATTLATTMVLRGAVGSLIGAAVAPKGREGFWGAVGFGMGAALGEIGIMSVALAALWRKA